jgi:hypothetical protein
MITAPISRRQEFAPVASQRQQTWKRSQVS